MTARSMARKTEALIDCGARLKKLYARVESRSIARARIPSGDFEAASMIWGHSETDEVTRDNRSIVEPS
jgi:hypothetical protein